LTLVAYQLQVGADDAVVVSGGTVRIMVFNIFPVPFGLVCWGAVSFI